MKGKWIGCKDNIGSKVDSNQSPKTKEYIRVCYYTSHKHKEIKKVKQRTRGEKEEILEG